MNAKELTKALNEGFCVVTGHVAVKREGLVVNQTRTGQMVATLRLTQQVWSRDAQGKPVQVTHWFNLAYFGEQGAALKAMFDNGMVRQGDLVAVVCDLPTASSFKLGNGETALSAQARPESLPEVLARTERSTNLFRFGAQVVTTTPADSGNHGIAEVPDGVPAQGSDIDDLVVS